jgi:4-hydroxybenzoate polyprenyltransferase
MINGVHMVSILLKIWDKICILLELVKFEHTIFALPFAYLGAVLAYQGIFPIHYWLWITLAMIGARTAGMCLNRLIDKNIDAKNPRTAGRALPQGIISVPQVIILTICSFVLLFVAACNLNLLCVVLSPVVVAMLIGYSYLKRFTWLTHFGIGAVLACAPVGGWIAIQQNITLVPIILGLSVLFWTAGFDIIYATQDVEFDRKYNIYSIPRIFGIKNALSISRILHLTTIIGLCIIGIIENLHMLYWIGVIATGVLLIYEHSIISPEDLSRVNQAFFTINGIVSIVLFVTTVADLELLE